MLARVHTIEIVGLLRSLWCTRPLNGQREKERERGKEKEGERKEKEGRERDRKRKRVFIFKMNDGCLGTF
jgi:hypothetical protein